MRSPRSKRGEKRMPRRIYVWVGRGGRQQRRRRQWRRCCINCWCSTNRNCISRGVKHSRSFYGNDAYKIGQEDQLTKPEELPVACNDHENDICPPRPWGAMLSISYMLLLCDQSSLHPSRQELPWGTEKLSHLPRLCGQQELSQDSTPTSLAAQALHELLLASEHVACGVSEFMGHGMYRVCEEISLQKGQLNKSSLALCWYASTVLGIKQSVLLSWFQ